jgi:hypothetical protein
VSLSQFEGCFSVDTVVGVDCGEEGLYKTMNPIRIAARRDPKDLVEVILFFRK